MQWKVGLFRRRGISVFVSCLWSSPARQAGWVGDRKRQSKTVWGTASEAFKPPLVQSVNHSNAPHLNYCALVQLQMFKIDLPQATPLLPQWTKSWDKANPILSVFLAVTPFNKRTFQVSCSMIYWCLLNFVWFSVTTSTRQKNKTVPSSWLVRFSGWGEFKGVSEFLYPINSKKLKKSTLKKSKKIYPKLQPEN